LALKSLNNSLDLHIMGLI